MAEVSTDFEKLSKDQKVEIDNLKKKVAELESQLKESSGDTSFVKKCTCGINSFITWCKENSNSALITALVTLIILLIIFD